MNSIKEFWSESEKRTILFHIAKYEKNTSSELKIHIEDFCKIKTFDRALEVFYELNMNKTKNKNGVLIYISVLDRKAAIIADKGINDKIDSNYWDNVLKDMLKSFKQKENLFGITNTIDNILKVVSIHFPYSKDDKNELKDTITFTNKNGNIDEI